MRAITRRSAFETSEEEEDESEGEQSVKMSSVIENLADSSFGHSQACRGHGGEVGKPESALTFRISSSLVTSGRPTTREVVRVDFVRYMGENEHCRESLQEDLCLRNLHVQLLLLSEPSRWVPPHLSDGLDSSQLGVEVEQTGKPGDLLLLAAPGPGQPACKVGQEKRN